MTLNSGKKCSCGMTWFEVTNLKEWIDDEMALVGKDSVIGYFFNCTCNSTLFIPINSNLLKGSDNEVSVINNPINKPCINGR